MGMPLGLPNAPTTFQNIINEVLRDLIDQGVVCDTGTSGQRWSDGNIGLVRFLDSHEGDGARVVFAGVPLLYKNNSPNDPPSKFAHR